MKLNKHGQFLGNTIRNDERYTVKDSDYLKHLTVSETYLNANWSTKGHSHPGKEEVYFFTFGRGAMLLGDELFPVEKGDIIAVADGLFHKVVASETGLRFIAVFEKYEGR
jgi:mannose-6-phosphate isomerase-like protein (cupin superfamily)